MRYKICLDLDTWQFLVVHVPYVCFIAVFAFHVFLVFFLVCDFSMVFCFYISGYLFFSHSFKCYIVDYFFTGLSLCLLVNVFHCTRLECMPLFIICLVLRRSMDGIHSRLLLFYLSMLYLLYIVHYNVFWDSIEAVST